MADIAHNVYEELYSIINTGVNKCQVQQLISMLIFQHHGYYSSSLSDSDSKDDEKNKMKAKNTTTASGDDTKQ
eukprot:8408964-Ditylum_brightwellii.AAC.1